MAHRDPLAAAQSRKFICPSEADAFHCGALTAEIMKTLNPMRPTPLKFPWSHLNAGAFWGALTLVASVFLSACVNPKPLTDVPTPPRLPNCQFIPVESIAVTQQDALPGIESNLRKQRTYRLELQISEADGDEWLNVLEQMNGWELWVDSVAVPVRFRPMQKQGNMLFSGSRMFYGVSSGGSMQLPVEKYAIHGAALQGKARLVGYNSNQCYASELDTLSALPLIVAP